MKREHWLFIGTLLISLGLGLLIIKLFAPQLLGAPRDAQIVKLSKALPSFYDNIFRNPAERESNDFLIHDPVTLVRARPLAPDNIVWGPHDILGFRNHNVPQVAPIIVIGDSQTYGNNVELENNWPNRMLSSLGLPPSALYSMATGGWSAVQYLNMFALSVHFHPRVIIVAYYTGNDPLESFKLAYGIDQWGFLRPDKSLKLSDMPNVPFPAPESEWWRVNFHDGSSMIFTPRLRYYSNDPSSPAANAGYSIMAETARIMDETAKDAKLRLVFTIIPTKELVYAKRIEREGITPSPEYKNLIDAEMQHISELESRLGKLKNSSYVNVIADLQQRALKNTGLYPEDANGHPYQPGYSVIGETLAKSLDNLPKPKPGIVALMGPDKNYQLYLINREGVWQVPSEKILDQNGWKPGAVENVEATDLAFFRWQGILNEVDPKRFGPE